MTFPFHWSIEDGQVWTQLLTHERRPKVCWGTVAEVLADLNGIAKAPPTEFAWRVTKPSALLCASLANGIGRIAESREGTNGDAERSWHDVGEDDFYEVEDAKWRRAARERVRNVQVLHRIADCGLVLDSRVWRVLSFNAVLHFQFGPGLAVATNGTDVLLWAGPYVTCDWHLVHRSNVIGPVSGTEYDVSEWDYEGNRPSGGVAKRRIGGLSAKEIRASILAEL